MADLTLANSTYQSGTNDTATTLVDNVDTVKAQHPNGANSAIVQIETILGSGTTLKGSAADLGARLAVEHNADGTHKNLTVAEGGTGVVTVPAGAVLGGAGTSALVNSGAGSAGQPLVSGGTGAPAWGSGLFYQGPTSTGTGSSQAHEGTVTIGSNQNLSGVHFYTNFTINAGATATVPTTKKRVVICATGTITINGTIDASRAGGAGGNGQNGEDGTDQPGGGGGGAHSGGRVLLHGIVVQAGGIAAGGNGTQVSGTALPLLLEGISAYGGAGGGDGDTVGGAGGGSIVLIAPAIVLGNASALKTSGEAGPSGATNGSGGGGAGNLYIYTHSYTDNGCTFTLTGGAAGVGGTQSGGAGANGIKQIMVY